MVNKITLPKDEEKRDYILYLYKNRNNYHNMNDKVANDVIQVETISVFSPIFEKRNFLQLHSLSEALIYDDISNHNCYCNDHQEICVFSCSKVNDPEKDSHNKQKDD